MSLSQPRCSSCLAPRLRLSVNGSWLVSADRGGYQSGVASMDKKKSTDQTGGRGFVFGRRSLAAA